MNDELPQEIKLEKVTIQYFLTKGTTGEGRQEKAGRKYRATAERVKPFFYLHGLFHKCLTHWA